MYLCIYVSMYLCIYAYYTIRPQFLLVKTTISDHCQSCIHMFSPHLVALKPQNTFCRQATTAPGRCARGSAMGRVIPISALRRRFQGPRPEVLCAWNQGIYHQKGLLYVNFIIVKGNSFVMS